MEGKNCPESGFFEVSMGLAKESDACGCIGGSCLPSVWDWAGELVGGKVWGAGFGGGWIHGRRAAGSCLWAVEEFVL